MQLTDYKVRILDSATGTAAKTRVLIESTDGKEEWGTVGVSDNIIEASLQALVDSMEYRLTMTEVDLNQASPSAINVFMSEIPKAYEPQAVEAKWYQFWLEQKCFVADPQVRRSPAYSIVIPPPNVTGMLHMGHVLNNTIQDILARKARMDGKEVLWLPGTDHAGIATQVHGGEDSCKKEEKTTGDDLGREEFLEARLGMEGEARRHHHPAAEEARLLLRLDARTLHDGPGVFRAACSRCSWIFTRRA